LITIVLIDLSSPRRSARPTPRPSSLSRASWTALPYEGYAVPAILYRRNAGEAASA